MPTHGQAASPTRLGKEIYVFVERLEAQLDQLKAIPFSAKFGGATGNFNAHHIAYPSINWKEFANAFVNNQLQLNRSQYTTQIEHYDNFAAHCDAFKRINNIILDLDRDMWMYIMMNYFGQKIRAGEVGFKIISLYSGLLSFLRVDDPLTNFYVLSKMVVRLATDRLKMV